MRTMNNDYLTVKMLVTDLPGAPEISISGDPVAVLRAVALTCGLDSQDDVEIRTNPQSDDGLPCLVVERDQAIPYPCYLAEVA